MGLLFGLFILFVLIVGLLNRRRQKKSWLKEERYDEGGAWMDKRAGERGTYGSLDAEMEQERKKIGRESQANEIALLVRDYAFEHYPGFHLLNDAQIKTFSHFAKTQSTLLIATIEQFIGGQTLSSENAMLVETTHGLELKKQMLALAYQRFPKLLDMEIDTIKMFDRYTGTIAETLIKKIEALKNHA
ncbi:MAG: hypothetical protein KF734_08000 [Saprospiraceae bacterium]|nr:hypothetical protein [Saprospiraceae bacterium]